MGWRGGRGAERQLERGGERSEGALGGLKMCVFSAHVGERLTTDHHYSQQSRYPYQLQYTRHVQVFCMEFCPWVWGRPYAEKMCGMLFPPSCQHRMTFISCIYSTEALRLCLDSCAAAAVPPKSIYNERKTPNTKCDHKPLFGRRRKTSSILPNNPSCRKMTAT